MDPKQFDSSAAGRCLWQPEGYWAFVPNPLPPHLELDWELARLLSEADSRVGELSGVGRMLQNPHLLIQPYMRREAVLSSRIEGTQAGMDDLFFFEASPAEASSAPDVQEVANYVDAMAYGLERLEQLPLSGRLVRELHERLMTGVRGGHATPGQFRTSQNWIGAPGCTLMEATFVPPPVAEMHEALSAWEKYLNADPVEPVLIQCALMHYQFEVIHPFIDGNGRVGRLLITLLLQERGLLAQPLLYLSPYFERHREAYYRHLLDVSQEGAWRAWVLFFLKAVAVQAQDAALSAKAIMDLHSDMQAQIRETGGAPRHTLLLLDELFRNPVVSVSAVSAKLDLNYSSVQRCFAFLERLGILQEFTGQQRNRLYVSQRLLEILGGSAGKRGGG